MEEWREIPGTNGTYEASSLGRIRSKDRLCNVPSRWGGIRSISYKGRVLVPWLDGAGYHCVYICVDGARTPVGVHRLVAQAFHGEPEGRHVNHISGEKLNNRPENLEWCTRSENMNHALTTGLFQQRKPRALEAA